MIVGIDLGHSYSSIAYLTDDRYIKLISNEEGNHRTPTILSFPPQETYNERERVKGEREEEECLIGESALYSSGVYSDTIVGLTSLLSSDSFDNSQLEFSSLRLLENPRRVYSTKTNKEWTMEYLCSLLLRKLKHYAELRLGKIVTEIVITIPSYFNTLHRNVLKRAAELADLNIFRMLPKPLAIAYFYQFSHPHSSERLILFLNLGGRDLNVAVGVVDEDSIEMMTSDCLPQIGGDSFNDCLIEYLLKDFQTRFKCDVSSLNPHSRWRLRQACERAKRALSISFETEIQIPSFYRDLVYRVVITRTEFEAITLDLVSRALRFARDALDRTEISPSQLQEIVLTGGSTRIPRFQQSCSESFPGIRLNFSLNPEETASRGAALLAGLTTVEPSPLLLQCTPYSYGLETVGGFFTTILKENTVMPARRSQIFTTFFDDQTSVIIRIFEAKEKLDQLTTSQLSVDQNFLYEFLLTDIPPFPRGKPEIEVTFDVVDLVLSVTATELSTGRSISVNQFDYQIESSQWSSSLLFPLCSTIAALDFTSLIDIAKGLNRSIQVANISTEFNQKSCDSLANRCEILSNNLSFVPQIDDVTTILFQKGEEIYYTSNSGVVEKGLILDCDGVDFPPFYNIQITRSDGSKVVKNTEQKNLSKKKPVLSDILLNNICRLFREIAIFIGNFGVGKQCNTAQEMAAQVAKDQVDHILSFWQHHQQIIAFLDQICFSTASSHSRIQYDNCRDTTIDLLSLLDSVAEQRQHQARGNILDWNALEISLTDVYVRWSHADLERRELQKALEEKIQSITSSTYQVQSIEQEIQTGVPFHLQSLHTFHEEYQSFPQQFDLLKQAFDSYQFHVSSIHSKYLNCVNENTQTIESFMRTYYSLLSSSLLTENDKEMLASLYASSAILSYQGEYYLGPSDIVAKLSNLGLVMFHSRSIQVDIQFGYQPSTFLVHIVGLATMQEDKREKVESTFHFTQLFHLEVSVSHSPISQQENSCRILNEFFRFIT